MILKLPCASLLSVVWHSKESHTGAELSNPLQSLVAFLNVSKCHTYLPPCSRGENYHRYIICDKMTFLYMYTILRERLSLILKTRANTHLLNCQCSGNRWQNNKIRNLSEVVL